MEKRISPTIQLKRLLDSLVPGRRILAIYEDPVVMNSIDQMYRTWFTVLPCFGNFPDAKNHVLNNQSRFDVIVVDLGIALSNEGRFIQLLKDQSVRKLVYCTYDGYDNTLATSLLEHARDQVAGSGILLAHWSPNTNLQTGLAAKMQLAGTYLDSFIPIYHWAPYDNQFERVYFDDINTLQLPPMPRGDVFGIYNDPSVLLKLDELFHQYYPYPVAVVRCHGIDQAKTRLKDYKDKHLPSPMILMDLGIAQLNDYDMIKYIKKEVSAPLLCEPLILVTYYGCGEAFTHNSVATAMNKLVGRNTWLTPWDPDAIMHPESPLEKYNFGPTQCFKCENGS